MGQVYILLDKMGLDEMGQHQREVREIRWFRLRYSLFNPYTPIILKLGSRLTTK